MRRALRFLLALVAVLTVLAIAGEWALSSATRAWFDNDVSSKSRLAAASAQKSLISSWGDEERLTARVQRMVGVSIESAVRTGMSFQKVVDRHLLISDEVTAEERLAVAHLEPAAVMVVEGRRALNERWVTHLREHLLSEDPALERQLALLTPGLAPLSASTRTGLVSAASKAVVALGPAPSLERLLGFKNALLDELDHTRAHRANEHGTANAIVHDDQLTFRLTNIFLTIARDGLEPRSS